MLPRRGPLPPMWKGKETRRGNTKDGGIFLISSSDRGGVGGIEALPGNPGDAIGQSPDSLLVSTYRIIAKNVKCIDLKNIDRHHKRANQNALNHFLREE